MREDVATARSASRDRPPRRPRPTRLSSAGGWIWVASLGVGLLLLLALLRLVVFPGAMRRLDELF